MLIPVALVFLPVIGGCIAELLGVNGALMAGMVISLVFISIGCIIMTWEVAGPLGALGGVIFASIFAGGVWAAQKHEDQSAARQAPPERHRTS